MIYTVGETESYLRYFSESEFPKKKGRTDDFPGGSVWKTYDEAVEYTNEDFSVFGVLADWETETCPNKNGKWNDLLVDSLLILLN